MPRKVLTLLLLFSLNTQAAEDSVTVIPAEGLRAEQSGKAQKALSIYLDSLLLNKNNAALWLRVGHLYYQLKNYNAALNAYEHARVLDSQNASIYKRLSEIYAVLNKPEDALSAIKKAVSLAPDNMDYLLVQGQLANWRKEPEIALHSYQHLLALKRKENPGYDPVSLLNQIGRLQSQLHHYDEALVTFNELILLKPDALTYQALSQNYAAVNKPAEAMLAIDKALEIQPDNIDFLQEKAMLAGWLNEKKLAGATDEQALKLATEQQKDPALISSLKNSIKAFGRIFTVSDKPKEPAQKHAPDAVPKLSPLEESIAQSNNAAVAHNYKQAAALMQKAVRLKPGDASLYKKLSEAYAMANQPAPALNAINQAVRIAPDNIAYLRARAQLASWNNDKVQMQDSYERILKLKPDDQNALLNIAFTYSWAGYTDRAIKAYQYYLQRYPDDPHGWLQYSEPLSWVEAYKLSLKALERSRALHGDYAKYIRIKARVLALAGKYKEARVINDSLLKKNPRDPYLLSTQITILQKNLQINQAITTLREIRQFHPDFYELKGLEDILLTPIRSSIDLGANYTWASDTTRVMQIPTVVGQYFITPATSFLVQGFYERAIAASDSGLNTIDGDDSIFDENLMIGFSTQIPALINLKGLIGDLKIQGKNNHLIYDALGATNLSETAQLGVESSYNLYRPYLIPQSPRLISLQIMENRVGALLQWQPFIQKYLNLVVSHSDLSDTNAYWHINVWPKARVFSSQKLQVSMGANSDTWNYKKRLSNGYFSPLHFQSYEGTIELYYALAHNIGCSLAGGFGMQKDESYTHYYYEEDLSGQLFLGIFTDWELKVSGGYTLRMNPDGSYRSWSSNLILTRRF